MADADGLAGGSGSGCRGGRLHITSTDATGKPTADLLRRVQLSSGKRAGAGDESPRAIIIWSLSLEQPENPLGAVSGPRSDKTSVGFAERLRRTHRADSTQASGSEETGRRFSDRHRCTDGLV
jgi:hypothetical protein